MGKNIIIQGANFAANAVDETPVETYYSISKSLSHCSLSNSATSIAGGTAYASSLSANTGYTISSVVVTMGGSDITASAYIGGSISIPVVTGHITITAVATADSSAGLFDNAEWFNGYWNASGTSATKKTGNNYLTCYFIQLPAGEDWVIAPKDIDGYAVGIRPYTCRSLSGTTPQDFTRSTAVYGNVSGRVSQTLSTATIRALDSSAEYFAVCLYANSTTGGSGMSLTNKQFTDLITATKL